LQDYNNGLNGGSTKFTMTKNANTLDEDEVREELASQLENNDE
jgi:hypothetical protein